RIYTHMDFKVTTVRADPAASSVEAEYRFDVDHGGSRTEVRSSTRVVGSSDSFHGVTALEVRAGGKPHFSRTWHTSVPRGFL
ncbi:MAG: hypothetical protein J4G11_05545, partial [Acidimicrobiia bacterium]|nr:hypothetical protein [Acidimicrobiia bacterium]